MSVNNVDYLLLILFIVGVIRVVSNVFARFLYSFFLLLKTSDAEDLLPYSTYVSYRFIMRFFCLILFMMFLLLFVVILLKTYILLGGKLN